MKKILKRTLPALLAGALCANCLAIENIFVSADDTHYELESGTVKEGEIREDSGASDGGYVFFSSAGQTATVTVPVETTGMYDIYLGYSAPYGTKTEYLTVNGENQGSISCTATDEGTWTEIKAGSAKLTAGDNTVGIECSWGWVNVDYIRIETTVIPEVTASDTSCCDTEATASTQKLMKYLSSVYGKNVLSGQQEYYGVSRDDEFDYIEEVTGELPVIKGFDFGDTCPLYAWEDGTTGRIISWVQDDGGIATASWHINVPVSMSDYTEGGTLSWDKTTYTEETDFVTANCMIDGTKEHEYFLRAVDNLATELKKLADADVPLLFRPFHEAEGRGGADGSGAWFWWAKEGSETYVELYQYLYELLTEEYGLHNLIWEFNSYTYSDDSTLFYPGRDYVDIIGYDKYNATTVPNTSAISSTFYSLISMYDNTKMIAMMENDTIPSVSNMEEEGAYWLYFMPWYGEHLMDESKNTKESLKEIYQSDLVITLSEFKEAYAAFEPSGTTSTWATTTKDPNRTTTTKATTTTKDPTTMEGTAATLKKGTNGWTINFGDNAIGDSVTLYLNADSSVSYANGCVGISVEADDTSYWVSYKWEISGSGDVTALVDLSTPFNVTIGNEEVTDESTIAEVVAMAQTLSSAEVQVWWANDGNGDSVATSKVTLVGATIPDGGSETIATTTTTEETTEAQVEETTTTTAATEETTIATEQTTTNAGEETTTTAKEETSASPEETTTTAAAVSGAVIYGDINLDGSVDITDAVLLNKVAAGMVSLNEQAIQNSDCNGDGNHDQSDVIVLMKFLVNLVKTLPSA